MAKQIKENPASLFVIILDFDASNPISWVYVARRSSLEDIRKVRQYNTADYQTQSKEIYNGQWVENIILTSVQTGEKAAGGIYKLSLPVISKIK